MTTSVQLREVTEGDIPAFFAHQLDTTANYMAAFTSEDPTDGEAYTARWSRLCVDDTVIARTILCGGEIAGHVAKFERDGVADVTYWIAKEFWGKGIATKALALLLVEVRTRPLFARVAKDNVASIRVLEKCGLTISGCQRGFANARGEEIDELVCKLDE